MGKMSEILIIGTHPIRDSIISQYKAAGCAVDTFSDFASADPQKNYSEICVLPNVDVDDKDTLDELNAFAMAFPQSAADKKKPVCHLLLHNKVTLWLFQSIDVFKEIHKKFELYAFSMADQWAKNVFCNLDCENSFYPHLDRDGIDAQSNKTVHLVIAGFSALGESLALHAALIAHYPNFVRNHALRTRITIIDKDILTRKDAFIQRYNSLFDHSYYRSIDLFKQTMTQFHRPIYSSTREDFVDVEWEFVDADFFDPILQKKINIWAENNNQLLTIALCDDDCDKNFDRAFAMPNVVYRNAIPVLVNLKKSKLLDEVRNTEIYSNLYPIGMDDCGYDISLPLLQMAKRLNYFYTCSYCQKCVPTDMPVEDVEREWRKLDSFSIRYSGIYHVMTIATKMRSLGHEEKDWDKFYALTQQEIEQISAVEHNRWSVERLILGYRPPTDMEREEIKKNIEAFIQAAKTGSEKPDKDLKVVYKRNKVHYDLCSYRELREDKTGQNVRVYDYDLTASIPLIAQSFKEAKQL